MLETQDNGPHGNQTMSTLVGWQLIADQIISEPQTLTAAAAPAAGSLASVWVKSGAVLQSASRGDSAAAVARTLDKSGSVRAKPSRTFFQEYVLLEEIGRGAFGKVAKARRKVDGRIVVVKDVSLACLSESQRSAARNEVDVLACLKSPHIVKYYDCFTSGQTLQIVMEYCEKGDLGNVLKRRGGQLLSEREIMGNFVQICFALQCIHRQGILHRDLKSCNIFCTAQDVIKLGDFGIAKIMSHDASMANTVVGTPYYLSPEICENRPYGVKSDVWALGCILYEMTCLKRAFDGEALSALVLKIVRGEYAPVPSHYSTELRALIKCTLARNPGDRPTIDEILEMPYVKRFVQQYQAPIYEPEPPPPSPRIQSFSAKLSVAIPRTLPSCASEPSSPMGQARAKTAGINTMDVGARAGLSRTCSQSSPGAGHDLNVQLRAHSEFLPRIHKVSNPDDFSTLPDLTSSPPPSKAPSWPPQVHASAHALQHVHQPPPQRTPAPRSGLGPRPSDAPAAAVSPALPSPRSNRVTPRNSLLSSGGSPFAAVRAAISLGGVSAADADLDSSSSCSSATTPRGSRGMPWCESDWTAADPGTPARLRVMSAPVMRSQESLPRTWSTESRGSATSSTASTSQRSLATEQVDAVNRLQLLRASLGISRTPGSPTASAGGSSARGSDFGIEHDTAGADHEDAACATHVMHI